MRVFFQRTDRMDSYQGTYQIDGHCYTMICLVDGEYEVPESKACQLVSDFPLNFSLPAAAGEKGMSPPVRNKAAKMPEKNR